MRLTIPPHRRPAWHLIHIALGRRRRLTAIAILLMTATVLTACSSAKDKTFRAPFTPEPLSSLAPGQTLTPTPPFQQDDTVSPSASVGDSSVDGGYTPIGHMVQHWDGVTITDDWSVGPITYGNQSGAPAAVLSACNITDPSQVASIAAIPVHLVVTFHGTVTTSVLIPPNAGLQIGLQPQANGGAYAAFTDTSGVTNWDCSDQTQSYSMYDGGHADLTIWLIVPGTVTNANPRPGDTTFRTWSFGEPTSIIGAGNDTVGVSGALAMSCQTDNGKSLAIALATATESFTGADGAAVKCAPA
ncbi:MAG: hypothetical protein ACR2N4_15970 [Jatrophihabitans sp.]